jgi:hypothetical protein
MIEGTRASRIIASNEDNYSQLETAALHAGLIKK